MYMIQIKIKLLEFKKFKLNCFQCLLLQLINNYNKEHKLY